VSAGGLVNRVRAHVRIARPFTWLWFDVLPGATLVSLLEPASPSPWALATFLVGVVLADAGVTTLNDVCDVETDRRSTEEGRRRRPLAAGAITARAATIQALVLCGAAPAVVATTSAPAALALLLAVLLGVAYSLPPLRLAGRPGFSLLFWPLIGASAYASAALFAGRWYTTGALLYALGVGLFYGLGEILAKDIRDWDNDGATGKRTSVVVIGPGRAAALSWLAGAAGALVLAVLLWSREAGPLEPGGATVALRVAGSAVLLAWLAQSTALVARLLRGFDKGAARRLHVAYIRAYLLYNACLLAALWLAQGGAS